MQQSGIEIERAGAGAALAVRAEEIGAARSVTPFQHAWSCSPDVPGRVQLWFVPVGAHRDLGSQARVLAREDWSAIARVRDEGARNHQRAVRIALRLALSHAVGNALEPRAWRFTTSSYGKPQVAAGLPPVSFSVSHIGTLSVIAVSLDGPVGVDIETIGPACIDKLAEAYCSARERRALSCLGEAAKKLAFARLWTLKEAYAKLTGTGLATDFRFLEFGAGSGLPSNSYQAQHVPGMASFQSWTIETPDGLCQVALAVGETQTEGECGELECFAIGDGGHSAAPRKHPGGEKRN